MGLGERGEERIRVKGREGGSEGRGGRERWEERRRAKGRREGG